MRRLLSRLRKAIASRLSGLNTWSVLKAAGVVAAVAAAVFSLASLRRHVASLPRFQVNVGSIAVANAPDWVQGDLIKRDLRLQLIPEHANILDPGLIPGLVSKYQSTDRDIRKKLHWLREITHVRKKYPNTLELKLSLRKPVACVRQGSREFLTDSLGVRLPARYYKQAGQPELMRVIGLEGRAPDEGERWIDSEALLGGLSAVEHISNEEVRYKAGITTVDVSNFAGRKAETESRIVLWTKMQTRILWGRSDRNKKFGDLTYQDKLENLGRALREYPDLKKMDYINVYSSKDQWPGMPRGVRNFR